MIGVLAVGAYVDIRAQLSAVANVLLLPQLIAPAPRNVGSLSILRRFGDDIDHAVDCVGSPQGTARTTDDFNSLDVVEQVVLHIPHHATIERRIYDTTVNQHEELVCQVGVESPRADGPVMRVYLRHLQVVRQSQ